MKKIAIIGAGISGLFIANLFKERSDYSIRIYEKNNIINLDEGYGIQLSTNSIRLLNKIGFDTLDDNEKFNPEKIDFYETTKEKKICDINISDFNSENCKYTTLKRSKLVEFLKNKLDFNIIKYGHNIERIEQNNEKIILKFNQNRQETCDYLIISDGVFSKSKSIISNGKIKPVFSNSIAIRGNISNKILKNLNKKNISLFMGNNFHYVIYPLNFTDDAFNFIGILRYKLTKNDLENYSFFKEETFIQEIKENLKNKISENIINNIYNVKCFPVFVSQKFFKPDNNIFLVGDAFFAFPPSFAQGASQSIEGGYDLFDNITNKKRNFYDHRIKKIKMVNDRSKLNQFIFHLSNPLVIFFRNVILKILTKNKKFLKNYLGKIYKD